MMKQISVVKDTGLNHPKPQEQHDLTGSLPINLAIFQIICVRQVLVSFRVIRHSSNIVKQINACINFLTLSPF